MNFYNNELIYITDDSLCVNAALSAALRLTISGKGRGKGCVHCGSAVKNFTVSKAPINCGFVAS